MLNHDWSIWSVPKASKSHPFHPICIHLHDFDWFRMCGPVVICQSLESVFFHAICGWVKIEDPQLGWVLSGSAGEHYGQKSAIQLIPNGNIWQIMATQKSEKHQNYNASYSLSSDKCSLLQLWVKIDQCNRYSWNIPGSCHGAISPWMRAAGHEGLLGWWITGCQQNFLEPRQFFIAGMTYESKINVTVWVYPLVN